MNTRTTLPQRRKLETRQRILDAAYAVFVRAGYGGASVDEIIAEADVSKGAVYHHFSGKEAIFRAILGDHVQRCADQMVASVTPDASINENVRNMLGAGWRMLREDPAWPVLQMEFWAHAPREEWAREALAASYRQCRELSAGMIAALQTSGMTRASIDAQAAARLFAAMFDGMLLQWQFEPDNVDPEQFVGPMADMITCYLTCKDEGSQAPTAQRGARQ